MKKLKIVEIVAVLLLLACLVSIAQAEAKVWAPEEEWNKTFGGADFDNVYSVQQTSDGGYILTGYTESYGVGRGDESYGAGRGNVLLIKTDSKGNEEWNKTFNGIDWDSAHSVQQTSDGGYIITGTTGKYISRTGGGRNVWLIKTDSNGNKDWDKIFGTDDRECGSSVAQTSDGGYIITGYTTSYGAGGEDVWLIKTDSNGNEIWNKTFGGVNDETGYFVVQTSDGGYFITGKTESYGTGIVNLWLIKTDSKGNVEWNFTKDLLIPEHICYVTYSCLGKQTSDEGYIIAGWINNGDIIGYDILLMKVDSKGNEEWNKTFGNYSVDQATSVQQTKDGGYIIVGNYKETKDREDIIFGKISNHGAWLIKTNSDGNEEWNKTFRGLSAYSGLQSSDGGYVIGGTIVNRSEGQNINLPDFDVSLVKIKPVKAPKEEIEVPTGEEKGIPGFEAIFAIAELLAVAYIFRRRK